MYAKLKNSSCFRHDYMGIFQNLVTYIVCKSSYPILLLEYWQNIILVQHLSKSTSKMCKNSKLDSKLNCTKCSDYASICWHFKVLVTDCTILYYMVYILIEQSVANSNRTVTEVALRCCNMNVKYSFN